MSIGGAVYSGWDKMKQRCTSTYKQGIFGTRCTTAARCIKLRQAYGRSTGPRANKNARHLRGSD